MGSYFFCAEKPVSGDDLLLGSSFHLKGSTCRSVLSERGFDHLVSLDLALYRHKVFQVGSGQRPAERLFVSLFKNFPPPVWV